MLYWTDWGTTPPRIETSSYDGSDRKILVNYTGLSIGGFDIDTRGNGVFTLPNTETDTEANKIWVVKNCVVVFILHGDRCQHSFCVNLCVSVCLGLCVCLNLCLSRCWARQNTETMWILKHLESESIYASESDFGWSQMVSEGLPRPYVAGGWCWKTF